MTQRRSGRTGPTGSGRQPTGGSARPVPPAGPVPSAGPASATASALVSPADRIRSVLRIHDFRWLWFSLAASSLGDWLGLLARTAMATDLAHGYRAANFALGGVLVAQLLPAVLLGPIAGVFADRFDRRRLMIFCDVVRFGIFASIPIANSLTWLFAASFLIECFGVFWRPAKEASVPNLLHRKDQIESANQLSLITTYGITPVLAAVLFAVLAWASHTLGLAVHFFHADQANQVDLAMYLNSLTFLFAAFTVLRIHRIGGHRDLSEPAERMPSTFALVREGLAFVGSTRLVRGLVIGILGAFAAGGTVIGTGKIYAASLGGGDASYGLLFGALFVGLGLGMAFGPRAVRELSRQRMFGLSIITAAMFLAILSVVPHLVFAIIAIVGVGFFAGVAYLAGMTLLGAEVSDEIRGRTFAFVQSMVQVVLLATLAAVPFLVGLIKAHAFRLGDLHGTIDGSRFLLFAGGVVGVVVGIVAHRQMDDRRDVPLVTDFVTALRGEATPRCAPGGLFVAFEGGEGAGKTTQVTMLADWLRELGLDVVATHEPGATETGQRIREIVLHARDVLAPQAEALLFAADRADHVERVIRPALDAGKVVLTDRYVDSSLAYQGAGRELALDEVLRISRWATGDLHPDLTVLLDLDPIDGLSRIGRRSAADRMESEPLEFHRRIRDAFRSLAEANPGRYLVVDARADPLVIAAQVRAAVEPLMGGQVAPDRDAALDVGPDHEAALDDPSAGSAPGTAAATAGPPS